MMQIPCIHCGLRDESEFTCGGASHLARPPLDQSDATLGRVSVFHDVQKTGFNVIRTAADAGSICALPRPTKSCLYMR